MIDEFGVGEKDSPMNLLEVGSLLLTLPAPLLDLLVTTLRMQSLQALEPTFASWHLSPRDFCLQQFCLCHIKTVVHLLCKSEKLCRVDAVIRRTAVIP